MDMLSEVLTTFAGLGAIVILLIARHGLRLRRLRSLAARLGGRLEANLGLFADLDDVHVHGDIEGRAVEVAYLIVPSHVSDRSRKTTHLRVKAELTEPVAPFTVRRRGKLDTIRRRVGGETPGEPLGGRYAIEPEPDDALARLLAEPWVESAIDALLGTHGFESVGVDAAWLCAKKECSTTQPAWLETVLDLVAELASRSERSSRVISL